MRCLGCGYDLTHNSTGRCPECGRGFDRSDPATFQSSPIKGRSIAIQSLAGTAPCFAPLGALLAAVAAGGSTSNEGRLLDLMQIASVLAAVVGLLMVFASAFRARRGLQRHWVNDRWCCWLALVPALVMFLIVFVGLAVGAYMQFTRSG